FMEGRIVQVGTPKEVFLRPANAIVAAFIGTPPMNLLPATLAADGQVDLEGARLPVNDALGHEGREITLGIRPGDLRIAQSGIPAQVELVEDLGDSVIAIMTVGVHQVKVRLGQYTRLGEGERVFLTFAPEPAHVFDRKTGERLASTSGPLNPSQSI